MFKILTTYQHVTTQSLRSAAVEVWIMQKASKQIYVNMATDQSEQTSDKITPNIQSANHTPQCLTLYIH